MIFITKIQNVGDIRIIRIPNMYDMYDYSDTIINIDCGGAGDEGTILIDGGNASSIFTYTFDCGNAKTGTNITADFNFIDCGGAMEQSEYNFIDCGDASTIYNNFIDCGGAFFAPKNAIEVEMVHTITRRKYNSVGDVKNASDSGFDCTIEFNEIPPEGQYYINVVKNNNYIYKGLAQIGETRRKNKEYDKKITKFIYEK